MAADETQLYLNDNWTPQVKDLGYLSLRDELVELAKHADPPFATAVYGGWGSGKTSLMRAVMRRLGGKLLELNPDDVLLNEEEEDPVEVSPRQKGLWESISPSRGIQNIECVWFNPWQHQNEAHPMIALLHEIRRQFSWRLKSMDQAKKIGHVALRTGLRLLDDLAGTVTKTLYGHKLSLGVDKIEATGTTYEKEHLQTMLDSQRFQMHFENAVAHLVGGTKPKAKGRLIIFIDDLDRCESAACYKLLESIKLYLSTRKCLFFLGLDPEHTERSLHAAGLTDAHHARAYLHKLFQMSVHLPQPDSFKSFIANNFKLLDGPAVFLAVPAGTVEGVPGGTDAFLEFILEANPRRIKNFLNQLAMRGRLLKARRNTRVDLRLLALLLALRNYYPKVYSALEGSPDSLSRIRAGMMAVRPKDGDDGFHSFVARETYLPQLEEKDPENDVDLAAAETEHFADQRGLFWVLGRFKQAFIQYTAGITTDTLEHYLQP